MSSTTHNLFAIGTNLGGLERFLRGLQALLHLLTTTPLLYPTLTLLSSTPLSQILHPLNQTKHLLNITRRFMRLFRFVDPLSSAAASMSLASRSPEALLETLKETFFGIHGFLETVLDLAGVRVWGVEMDRRINEEAMKMWFMALGCSLLVSLLRMFSLRAYAPVNAVDSFGDVKEVVPEMEKEKVVEKVKKEDGDGEDEGEEKKIAAKAKEEKELKAAEGVEKRKKAEVERKAKMGVLQRRFLADGLDIFLPADGLHWVKVEQTVLGGIMFMTTILGFVDTWGTY